MKNRIFHSFHFEGVSLNYPQTSYSLRRNRNLEWLVTVFKVFSQSSLLHKPVNKTDFLNQHVTTG